MKRLLIAGATALALLGSSAAMARVDVGISIGVPGLIYGAPEYYAPPPVIVVPERRYYRPAYVYEAPRYYRHGHYGHRGHRGDKHWRKHHRDRD